MSDEREQLGSDETIEVGQLEPEKDEEDFEGHQLEVGQLEEGQVGQLEEGQVGQLEE